MGRCIDTIMTELIKNMRDTASQELLCIENTADTLLTAMQECHNTRRQIRSHLGGSEHLDQPTVATIQDHLDELCKHAEDAYNNNERKRDLCHDLICSYTRALKKQKTTEPPEPP